MDQPNRLLIVDDEALNRELLGAIVESLGHETELARDGLEALTKAALNIDLVLLDIMMPQMDGHQVLAHLKADPTLRHIPVVVISAVDSLDSVVRCIELGAEDYLTKPFNRVLLKARIGASLEKKRLRDQEQAYLQQIQAEREKSERLLLNILPRPIADRLKQTHSVIADKFDEVTVLFCDIVGFTMFSGRMSPADLVNLLNNVFSAFDDLTEKHGLEKIKTIGDRYMVAGGLPIPRSVHAEAVAEMALDMKKEIARFQTAHGQRLRIRIGINTGPVVAGVIGTKKFIYDLWGDTVNIAARMESHGLTGSIQVTAATYECLWDKYLFEKRGVIHVKGKGEMITYLLTGKSASSNPTLVS